MLAKVDARICENMFIDGLDASAGLLHMSAIAWVYAREQADCRLPALLTRLGVAPCHEPDEAKEAAAHLVAAGYWLSLPDGGYELIDHADVIKKELATHKSKKARDKDGQARQRSGINAQVIERDGGKCRACGTTNYLTVDHIFPQQLGGCRELANLQALCRSCNSRKGARIVDGIACCGARSPRCGEAAC